MAEFISGRAPEPIKFPSRHRAFHLPWVTGYQLATLQDYCTAQCNRDVNDLKDR